jgi:hypothetical protein
LEGLDRPPAPDRRHGLRGNPDPVQIATEGAPWGSIKAHGLLADTVIVSDDADRFDVGQHGLWWVHAERLVRKLDTFTDAQCTAPSRVRRMSGDLPQSQSLAP